MQQTAARLTSVSRRLTTERGLNGFTVEEVCSEVNVSRRTFFNYYPSKEDAIIGAHPDEDLERIESAFLERGSSTWTAVMDDLIDLVIEHFESAGLDATGHAELAAALEREPKLLLRLIGVSRERDKQVIALVARRENVPIDDPRAEASVEILTALLKSVGERYLTPHNTQEFSTLIHDRLAAMRAVLAPSAPRKGTP